MPAFDGTGPMGMGPGTGWGFGPCGLGMGWGRRFGRGRGLGRFYGWGAYQSKADQQEILQDYVRALEEELADVKKELVQLKKSE